MIFLVFLQWPASRVTSCRNGSVKSFDFSRSNSSSGSPLSVSGQHRQLDAGLIISVVSRDTALSFLPGGEKSLYASGSSHSLEKHNGEKGSGFYSSSLLTNNRSISKTFSCGKITPFQLNVMVFVKGIANPTDTSEFAKGNRAWENELRLANATLTQNILTAKMLCLPDP